MSSAPPSDRQATKIFIVQRFLPHYRVTFFDTLQAHLQQHNQTLEVFFGDTMGKTPDRPWKRHLFRLRRDFQAGEIQTNLIVMPGLLTALIRERPGLIVTEDLAGLPNSLIVAVYCKITHTPYLIWGLGKIPGKTSHWLRRAAQRPIQFLYRHTAGFIGYSSHARETYQQYAKPCTVAHNACLKKHHHDALLHTQKAIEQRFPIDTLNIIAIGSLQPQKRLDLLVHAAAELDDQRFRIEVIGDGPERAALTRLAAKLGIADRIVFHGALYDQADKREALLRAHIGVLPGRGGLAIQELMSHGIPVITGVADGTERDLIDAGINGYLSADFLSTEDIRGQLNRFRGLDRDAQLQMSLEAFTTTQQRFNIDTMASAFVDAIQLGLADGDPDGAGGTPTRDH